MSVFFLTFFILAPTLIFYASGYRLDLKRIKILKTGTLYIEADKIRDGQLYINDNLLEDPFNKEQFVYNLLPGEYKVKLMKDGYYSWEKSLTINSSLTTFVNDLILFKKNVPLQMINDSIENFYLSNNKQQIVYTIDSESFTEIYLYVIESKEITLLYRIPQTQVSISWAASDKKLLVSTITSNTILEISNPQNTININKVTALNPDNVNWDIHSDNLIYFTLDNSIYRFNILALEAENILTNQNSDSIILSEIFIEGNDIFYIKQTPEKTILAKHNLNFETDKELITLNPSQNFKFISSSNNYLSIIDQDLQKLYMIRKIFTDSNTNLSGDQVIKEFEAINAIWDKNEDHLLIYSDFEIKTFDAQKNYENFIDRYGQEITAIKWHPKLKHLFVQFENKIDILDLETSNGSHNTTEILNFDRLYNFESDAKGEIIYFSGQIGKQSGIYKLELK